MLDHLNMIIPRNVPMGSCLLRSRSLPTMELIVFIVLPPSLSSSSALLPCLPPPPLPLLILPSHLLFLLFSLNHIEQIQCVAQAAFGLLESNDPPASSSHITTGTDVALPALWVQSSF